MRITAILLIVLLMSGCAAMVLGNGSSNGASRTSASGASDASISKQVEANFAADATLGQFNLSARSYSGSVILSGSVDNYIAREQAGKLAKATNGVRAVTNQIVVEN